MRLAIIASRSAAHQIATAEVLRAGLAVHGDTAVIFPSPEEFDKDHNDYDAMCVWGARKLERFRHRMNVLIMERAYLADRFHWVSLGWNGLNGRAAWPQIDSRSRWEQHFAHLMQPWRFKPDGYALILGQVPTDASVRHISYLGWAAQTAENLRRAGYQVRFRPHPRSAYAIPGNVRDISTASLAEDLDGARFTVSFNSNSGVDSVLAGVPSITADIGSMAWDVSSHQLLTPELTPDRINWAARLAWKQWLPDEIEDGTAWDFVKAAMPQLEAA